MNDAPCRIYRRCHGAKPICSLRSVPRYGSQVGDKLWKGCGAEPGLSMPHLDLSLADRGIEHAETEVIMSKRQQAPIGALEQINILLREYDALRAEIRTRITQRWQVLGYLGAILVFVGTQGGAAWSAEVISACLVALALGAIWIRTGHYVVELHLRVAEIEKTINVLAGQSLLRWESSGPDRFLVRFHLGQ